MNILLKKLIPHPVKELPHQDSEIWEKEEISLGQGQLIQFTASSGKGKTSLLSIIYGIRKDYSGEVLIDKRTIRTFNERKWTELRKNSLSYIFQGLELFDELTGFENIQLNNRQKNHKSPAMIREMAEKIEIASFLNKECGKLSYGQKQRVAIIRALCQPFNFLLADEIFSHLDEAVSKKAASLIKEELSRTGAGLLFTDLKETGLFTFDKNFRI